ncbi:MAG: hypothetical protein K0U68_03910 [Gammaproteobacteria bacterium]|nr:hypothetical protein [Gammaproteobacteria bacterium]
MCKFFLTVILLQAFSVQAEVVHRIQFCAGKFCANTAPLTIAQQLELNQQYESGNLLSRPSTQNGFKGGLTASQTQKNTIVITNRAALDTMSHRTNRF